MDKVRDIMIESGLDIEKNKVFMSRRYEFYVWEEFATLQFMLIAAAIVWSFALNVCSNYSLG